ncbi:RNA polymerase sigma factor [Clostridium uliginosum]|uniref:RNA polymerase sigma-70 factor, ECF subfamily n=1 Tax=Clostridium uliginosum TaxID=119641 RepID=A0A1I1I7T3_9CLOT|nr:sigma-70 family RNA polymerase sigma factor [Clostridium uliginosum]SFC32121.1 RNA polymerase sigma-70 factor, ECF subfamily [Clostridium uliginosum]
MEQNNIEEVLTDIYNITYDDVLRYVVSKCRSSSDIADLMQNIYLNFYKALKNKREILEPKKYLIRIARNEIYKHYGILKMAQNYVPVFSSDDEMEFQRFECNLKIESDYESKLLCKEIWNYLEKKDLLTFKIFILYFKNDLKIKDIGKSLNISESTVKNRLYRTMNEMNNEFNI